MCVSEVGETVLYDKLSSYKDGFLSHASYKTESGRGELVVQRMHLH